MNQLGSLFRLESAGEAAPIAFAAVLLVILIISFRSRAVVFCQYLKAMTGVDVSPAEVRRIYRASGKTGVRELFLDLLIRQDFVEQGPVHIPETPPPAADSTSPSAPATD